MLIIKSGDEGIMIFLLTFVYFMVISDWLLVTSHQSPVTNYLDVIK